LKQSHRNVFAQADLKPIRWALVKPLKFTMACGGGAAAADDDDD
jgi:hypothetical protein